MHVCLVGKKVRNIMAVMEGVRNFKTSCSQYVKNLDLKAFDCYKTKLQCCKGLTSASHCLDMHLFAPLILMNLLICETCQYLVPWNKRSKCELYYYGEQYLRGIPMFLQHQQLSVNAVKDKYV